MRGDAIFNDGLVSGAGVAPRRLGSVFPPLRNLYLLYLPLIMFATAIACWVVETDTMLIVGSVILGLISVYIFYGLVIRQEPLRITTLLMTTLGLGYGLGTANTWFSLPRAGEDLAVYLHKDPHVVTHGLGSVLFSLAILLAVGEMAEKPIFGEEFELEFPPQVILFITVAFGLILVAFARGSLSFMGGQTIEGGGVGVFTSFAVWLLGALFAVTLVAALNVKSKAMSRYLMLLTLAQFFLNIPIGRRVLLYTLVLGGIGLRLGRFRFHWSWPKRIVICVLLGFTLYLTSIAFFYLRLAGYSSGKVRVGLGERISLAINLFETKSFDAVQQSLSENVQKRTFILGYLAEVEDYSTHFDTGYGRDLIGQFQYALPSVLYPSKNQNFGEEGLANELFGSVYLDEANSVLTGGIVDFGLLGMVLYPLLVCLMLRTFMEFIGQHLPTFVATFIILAALAGLLQPENLITDYFIMIRNGLLFGTVIWFFIALPAFRLRKEN